MAGGAGQTPSHPAGAIERAFGQDLSAVRVHTSAEDAARINERMSAMALAHGDDIFFRNGAFTGGGQALLGHELAHVVQQRAGRTPDATEVLGQLKMHAALKR